MAALISCRAASLPSASTDLMAMVKPFPGQRWSLRNRESGLSLLLNCCKGGSSRPNHFVKVLDLQSREICQQCWVSIDV